MILTNSEITCWQHCQREHYYRYRLRRTGEKASPALDRGTRIHAWLAAYWSGESPTLDGLEPVESAAVQGYAARWEQAAEGAQVNVPFSVDIGSVTMVGELDAFDGTDIIEHKTTTSDISPGSAYWQERSACDRQVSIYLAAFPGATVLYDVIRMSALRQLGFTKTRAAPEPNEAYVARMLEDISERPDYYYQRAQIVRLPEELDALIDDVTEIAEDIGRDGCARSPKSCFSYGRRCDFFEACWQGRDINTFPQAEMNHTEQVKKRLDAYRG